MTSSRDPDQLIRKFLEEGTTDLPDRTFDSVRAAIEVARQRVVIGPWREPTMSTTTRVLAIAAVVVIAIAAISILPKQPSVGGSPTPSPTATEVPSPKPTSTPFAAPTEVACSLTLTTPAAGGSILRAPFTVPLSSVAYPINGPAPSSNPAQLPYAQVNFRVGGLTPPVTATVGLTPPVAGSRGFGTLTATSLSTRAVMGTFVLDAPGDWHLQINIPSDGCSLQVTVTVVPPSG